jgi:FdhD protein
MTNNIDNENNPHNLTAVVLAGGRSLRMGVDKTQMILEGQPLLVHAVEAIHSLATQTIVVTNRPDEVPVYRLPDDIRVVTDEIAYQGPLGGLATACTYAENDWVLICAADMPWIDSRVVEYLWSLRKDADVVIPVGPQGPEPLLALYRKETVEPVARAVLASGRRRIIAMFDDLRVTEVARQELEAIDGGLSSFYNINTPADFEKARTKARITSKVELTDIVPSQRRGSIRLLSSREAGRKMPTETPITIYLNEVEVATVQASGTDIADMAIGFLLSEGLVRDRSLLESVDIDAKRGVAYIISSEQVPIDLVHHTRYVTSGCGKGITFSSLGHARGITPIESDVAIEAGNLYSWMAQLSARSIEYRERGGCHSCGLVVNDELVLVREDIGRHNAVDKLLGHAWLEGIDVGDATLLASGRVSYEMIVKAAKSRIPIVASRSAATDLAVEIAEELNITLIGYVRGGKVIVYSHPERIFEKKDEQEEVSHESETQTGTEVV